LTACDHRQGRAGVGVCGFDGVHRTGERATHPPAPRSPRQASLLVLAGSGLRRPRA